MNEEEERAPLQASLLLHHLLNQTVSSLDFCILWQELTTGHPELAPVDELVQAFLESAELGYLDRALALLPEPPGSLPPPLTPRPTSIEQEGWTVRSRRVREVSRADFKCRECGWEITVSQEHEANTEMRLPFENFVCPHCHGPSTAQGSRGGRPNEKA